LAQYAKPALITERYLQCYQIISNGIVSIIFLAIGIDRIIAFKSPSFTGSLVQNTDLAPHLSSAQLPAIAIMEYSFTLKYFIVPFGVFDGNNSSGSKGISLNHILVLCMRSPFNCQKKCPALSKVGQNSQAQQVTAY